MKKRQKWLLYSLLALVFLVIAFFAFTRYIPWNKLVKVPSSGDMGFVDAKSQEPIAPHTLSLGFEIDSTQETPSGLYNGIAHSGNYSATVFGKNVFSISIHKKAEEIGLENLDGIGMSAWVYVFPTDREVNGSLVFSANNSVGVNICWKGIHFSGPNIPIEKWTKMSGYFDLSDVRFRPDDQLQLYFWNNSSTDILVDDFCFVFGAPSRRLGDSALVDMTTAQGYMPRFNMPPYPTLALKKEAIGNDDQVTLIPGSENVALTINPDDKVFAGHFITPPTERQSMLVIKPDGQPFLFHYCPEKQQFTSINLHYPASLPSLLHAATLHAGSFLPLPSYNAVLVSGKSGLALIGFSKENSPCSSEQPSSATVNIIWQSQGSLQMGIEVENIPLCVTGDLNGDKVTELLVLAPDGSWKLLQFISTDAGWRLLASGEEYPVREWDMNLFEYKLWAGPFFSDEPRDMLLTLMKDKKSGYAAYTMLRYLPGEKKFVRIYPDANQHRGLTFGLDTLGLTDQLWPVTLVSGEPTTWFRYNRDWRYDLKEIRFNDTTFQILRAIDFSGFTDNQNPKYYELLALHAGKWIDPRTTALLVIARNCKNLPCKGEPCPEYEQIPSLPNTLQLYSVNPKTK